MKLRPLLMSAALGASAPTLSGCASVHELNMDSCIKTDAIGPQSTLPDIIKWIIPGFSNTRPNLPCHHSQYFMGLVNIAQIKGNENNYHVQGLVVTAYEKLKRDSAKEKYARDTLGMIDQRLKAQGVDIKVFYDRYNTNKPTRLAQIQEANCWDYKTQESGKIYDDRICNVTVNIKIPKLQ